MAIFIQYFVYSCKSELNTVRGPKLLGYSDIINKAALYYIYYKI
jgi:hypothetical protein